MERDLETEVDDLQLLLEKYEQTSAKVAVLKEIIRKADDDDDETREQVPEEKIWTKDKAEAQFRVDKVEASFENSKKDAGAVVQGVKGYLDIASKEAKDKKYNQQKWGLFETNYQREKGIDVYDSLDEIEKFQKSGELPEEMHHKSKAELGASSVRSKLEENMNKDGTTTEAFSKGPGWKPGQSASSNNGAGKNTNSSSASGKMSPSGKGANDHLRKEKDLDKNKMIADFSNHMKNAGTEGAKFFDKYQKEQDKKYKPSHGM